MSDNAIAIRIQGEEAQNHASAIRWTSDDDTWVKALSDSEKLVRIRIPEGDDTEGHASSTAVTVVVADDDDDTEGHALSLHFPTVHDANDFRRKVIAAGLISATIAIGAAGGAAMGTALSGNAASDASAVSGQYAAENMGGTPFAQQQAANQGQYDATNMGGTPAAQQAANQGQYDATNMGGTPAAQQAANQGQYDATNMGGTPAAPDADEE
jgi:hypothetical protein